MKTTIMLMILLVSTASFAGGERVGNGTLDTVKNLGTLELNFAQEVQDCGENCNPNEKDSEWKKAFDQAKTLDVKSLQGKKVIFFGPNDDQQMPWTITAIDFTGPFDMAMLLKLNPSVGDLSDPKYWTANNPSEIIRELEEYTSIKYPLQKISEAGRDDYQITGVQNKQTYRAILRSTKNFIIVQRISKNSTTPRTYINYGYGKLVRETAAKK